MNTTEYKKTLWRQSFLLTLALTLLTLFSSQAALAAGKIIGRFAVAKGKVQVITDGKTQKARFGFKVRQGDIVVTEAKSRAKIVLLDKNIVHISPETKMAFESYDVTNAAKKTNVIGLLYGKIRNDVKQKYDGKNQKFQVRTKAAVAGVRGTDWISGYSRKTRRANFITFKGVVEVGILGPDGAFKNSVKVYAGQETSSTVGGWPKKPFKVPANKLKKMQNDSDTGGGDSDQSNNSKNDDNNKKDGNSEKKTENNSNNNENENNKKDSSNSGSKKRGKFMKDLMGDDPVVETDEMKNTENQFSNPTLGDYDHHVKGKPGIDKQDDLPEGCGDNCQQLLQQGLPANLNIDVDLQE